MLCSIALTRRLTATIAGRNVLTFITGNILTHTSNAKCFRNVPLINVRGHAEIVVPLGVIWTFTQSGYD